MSEHKTKRLVQVFPRPEWVSNVCCDTATAEGGNAPDCASSCGCGPATIPQSVLEDMLKKFQEKNADKAEVRIVDYAEESGIEASLGDLNDVLETSNQNVHVDKDNFNMLMFQAAPIIAVDGIIAFIRGVPSIEQMEKALEVVPRPAKS